MADVADAPNGNGYKALAAALLLGTLGGSGGTYFVAADYNKDITALKVEQARNECRLEMLERQEER